MSALMKELCTLIAFGFGIYLIFEALAFLTGYILYKIWAKKWGYEKVDDDFTREAKARIIMGCRKTKQRKL